MKRTPLILAALLTLPAAPLSAAQLTWDGGDALNNNWSDADNWNPSQSPAAVDILVFPPGPLDKTVVQNLAAGTLFTTLLFTGAGYSVSGNVFSTGGAGLRVNISGAGTATIQTPVSMGMAQEWDAGFDDVLAVNGLVSSTGHRLTCTGTGLIEFGGGFTGHGAGLTVNTSPAAGVRFRSASASSFNGATLVQQGILETGGTTTLSPITVEPDGVLGGKGTVFRVSTSGGTIQPGRAAGGSTDISALLTITSGLTCDSAATVRLNAGGATPGTGHDQIRVSGPVVLNDATLAVTMDAGYSPPWGTQLIILTNDGADPVQGTFRHLAEGALFAAGIRAFTISYAGGDGNDIVLTPANARVWTGNGANDLWTNPANWDNGSGAPAPGASLIFPDLGTFYSCENDFPGGWFIRQIVCTGNVIALTGNAIHLEGGIRAVTGQLHWHPDVTLTGPQTFAGLDGSLYMDGDVNLGGFALTLSNGNTNPNFAVGIEGIVSGTGSIITRGTGTIYLNDANTYTGGTTVQEGILDLQGAGSLGAVTSPCVVEAGALLQLSGNTSFTIPQPLVLRGTLRSAVPMPAPAILPVMTCSGPITLEGSAPVLHSAAPLTLSGILSGTAPLTKTGPERLRLSGPSSNTFTGGLTCEEGDIDLAKIPGARALPGPVRFGFGSQPATMKQLNSEQFFSTAQLAIGPKGTLHINGLDCGFTSLELTGGTVTGAPGQLRLASGITVLASPQTALINSRVFSASSTAVWTVENGAAVPDFKVSGTVENAGANPAVSKAGPGSLEITGSQLVQRILVSAGELQWDASGPARLQCDGGTITGNGSCSVLEGLAGGGTFSPGGSSAAIFHSTGAGLHANTACHFDLLTAASHDQLICAGPVVLNNAQLDLNAAQTFTAAPGTVISLVHCTATTPVNGTFAYLPEGFHLVSSGHVFRISYQGGDGNDITLTAADGTASINNFTVTPGSGPSSDQTSIAISATGVMGLNYTLESSTDLQLWTPLADASAGAGGAMQFALLEPAAAARKFYRLRTAGAS